MQKVEILALHGFLGQSSDWTILKNKLAELFKIEKKFEVVWHTPDLFSAQALEVSEFEDYVEKILENFEDESDDQSIKIFMGYSLGGRLGLHMLDLFVDEFDYFIFLSTNPGFKESDKKHKDARLLVDMKWAHGISTEKWDSFLTEWNAQTVFATTSGFQEPKRLSSDFDLKKLKQSLVIWSLSQQDDFRPVLKEYQDKISWFVGMNDSKYTQITEDLQKNKIVSDVHILPNVGHRIHMEAAHELAQFLKDLEFD